MEKINYGGSAFPIPASDMQGTGMSLRDYFAAKAMQAMIGNTDKDGMSRGSNGVSKFAKYAYEYADAMLKAREVKS